MNVFTSSILSLVIGLVLFSSCGQMEAQETAEIVAVAAVSGPSLSFDIPEHDFGEIDQGEVVSHEFEFTNNGDEPVTISKVKVGCGCTVGTYKKEPIMPGETGFISASFNSKGKLGKQRKALSVFSNVSEEPLTLFLTGEISTAEIKQTAQN